MALFKKRHKLVWVIGVNPCVGDYDATKGVRTWLGAFKKREDALKEMRLEVERNLGDAKPKHIKRELRKFQHPGSRHQKGAPWLIQECYTLEFNHHTAVYWIEQVELR